MNASAVRRQLANEVVSTAIRMFTAGLVSEKSGNVSARDAEAESMLITPSGRDCHSLSGLDVIRVHLPSGRVEGMGRPSSEWRLHAAIYQARHEVKAVVHHHGAWSSAVATARKTIPPLIDEAADLAPIPTAAYAVSGSQELADSAAIELGRGRNAVLLANHGAVAVGEDLAVAFRRAREVERLARIYVLAAALGGAHALDETAVARSQQFLVEYQRPRGEQVPGAAPTVEGHKQIRLLDVIRYGFESAITLRSLVGTLILQKLQRN